MLDIRDKRQIVKGLLAGDLNLKNKDVISMVTTRLILDDEDDIYNSTIHFIDGTKKKGKFTESEINDFSSRSIYEGQGIVIDLVSDDLGES